MMLSALLFSLAIQASAAPGSGAEARPAADEAAVLDTIDKVFAALEDGDGPALLEQVQAEGRITGVGKRADGSAGVRRRSFTEYATNMKPGQGFVERITSPRIEIDADIAMVWAPFTIGANGKVTSCGYDHFDLVREAGVWKVANLTFSTRTNCEAAPK